MSQIRKFSDKGIKRQMLKVIIKRQFRFFGDSVRSSEQETQLSRKDRATLHVTEYFAK